MTNRELPPENQPLEPIFSKQKLAHDLLIVAAVGLFIGFLAPFGMDELPVLVSISYWLVTCTSGYFIYTPMIRLGHRYLAKWVTAVWGRVALSTLIASMIMSVAVPLISWLFFSIEIELAKEFFQVFPKAIVIGGVMTFFSLVQGYIRQQKSQLAASKKVIEEHEQNTDVDVHLQFEQFMQLLPLEKRGQLMCLEMSDHYLKVHTDKGHHMLLMRLKDALEKLDGFAGMQTHRSWWVATEAIVSVNKDNRKMSLMLANGIEVPVSRTFVDAVKAVNI
ncbi:hypothetical protein CXF83_06525 [Shewanella sp. Choline-02u-19]|uniref:LytTR family DNA-binding domain-containing protein n=1 Tax=unclassified Shewanella TaxID=196818 RepID=UPI000C33B4F9|nr:MULTISPECIES: LytTR family DNA-binding domain-containing protein [unclassified Shewanella]PKH56734.1 hypothetical protein CXF84_12545 [Shewanella sp. Bg11-22]PKI30285.1 hypothetical protein CXF83_06525 [Shewanella sp. Choline-02u-19]